MDNVNKFRSIMYLVVICTTIAGTVTAAEPIHTETLVPLERVSASTKTQNIQVVRPIAAAQKEAAPKFPAEPSVQTPDHKTQLITIAAVEDPLSRPTVDAIINSLGKTIPAANAEMSHYYKPVNDKVMPRLMVRTINTQERTADNRTDSAGFPYVVTIVLLVFLGMVSVIRRDTRRVK